MGAAPDVEVVTVDGSGIAFRAHVDDVVDVRFDGRRIWSFWLLRDSAPGPQGVRRASWPTQLRRFLNGHTRLSLVAHVSDVMLFDADVQIGKADRQISVVDDEGRPLGVDKSGRVAHTFDTRSPEQVAPLLDAIETVLTALHEAGVEAFPAYGTLLGAVRDGRLIGHDSDADLGYVSRHAAPVDVIRESFALQRNLEGRGLATHRYSGAAFKVDVRESDGSMRGLDVFGGFLSAGRLYLMGEVGVPYEASWIFPLGSTTLEGRVLPAPAVPERLLEAMYGAGWRVPDPAFKFTTSPETMRRLSGWFRGIRVHQYDWSRRYSRLQRVLPEIEPTALASHVVACEDGPGRLVDLGAGRGSDSLWLARQGWSVTTLDFVLGASLAVQRTAAEEGLDLTARRVNLNEVRSWLAEGTRQARQPGPVTVLARHLADAVTPGGRQALWRFAQMALHGGGRLYLEFLRLAPEQTLGRTVDFLTPLSLDQVVGELVERGATIVSADERLEEPRLPLSPSADPRPVGRVVAEWRGTT